MLQISSAPVYVFYTKGVDAFPGPLPSYDKNHHQEDLSVRALRLAFPPDRFALREDHPDYGTDFSLELRMSGLSLNARAQLQLKSAKNPTANSDGSYSYPVETSNLNYLINSGGQALYVMYCVKQNELRYAWVWDIQARLQSESPDWIKKKKVAIRFTNLLDDAGLEDIFSRIYRTGAMGRQLLGELTAAVQGEKRRVELDGGELKVLSEAEAYQRILDDGVGLVGQARAKDVLDLHRLLQEPRASDPKILLLVAFAFGSLGQYRQALGHVATCKLRSNELEPDDQLFLDSMSDIAQLELGQITSEQFFERETERMDKASSSFSEKLRLQYLLRRSQYEDDPKRKLQYLDETLAAASSIIDSGRASNEDCELAFRLYMNASGIRLSIACERWVSAIALLRSIQLVNQQAPTIEDLRFAIDQYCLKIEEALTATTLSKHTKAELRRTRVLVRFLWNMALVTRGFAPGVSNADSEEVKGDYEQSASLFQELGNFEGLSNVTLLYAEFLTLCRQHEEGHQLAEGMERIVSAMGYRGLGEVSQQFSTGKSQVETTSENMQQLLKRDLDISWGLMDENELLEAARYIAQTMGLPSERFDNLHAEIQTLGLTGRTKLEWCGYLEVTVPIDHFEDSATRYAKKLDFGVRCERRDLETINRYADMNRAVQSFKEACCAGCKYRCPKPPITPSLTP